MVLNSIRFVNEFQDISLQQLGLLFSLFTLFTKVCKLQIMWISGTLKLRMISVASAQFSSVAQSCPTLCDPINHSTPGLPINLQLLDFTQTHVHWVCDVIQPSHPLSYSFPPTLNLSQHQGLFQWVSSSHQVAKVLEFLLQHQSFQWTPRTDLL